MRLRLFVKRFTVRLAFMASVLFALGGWPHVIFSAMLERSEAGQSDRDDDDDVDEDALAELDEEPQDGEVAGTSAPKRASLARVNPRARRLVAGATTLRWQRRAGRAPPLSIYKRLARMRC